MEKYELLREQLVYEGLYEETDFITPEIMSQEDLQLTHSNEFIDKLHTQTLTAKEIRAIGFPMTPLLVERGKIIANGTYQAAVHALQNGCGMNIAGGTHHSYSGHGEGFCVFNDIAIAANTIIRKHQVKKVLIIDLDVHQGNGTAKIFEHNDKIFTFSMHGQRNYPLRKEKSDLDIGLNDFTNDNEYLNILKDIVPKLISEELPDIIFYQSGVDILETDKLGRINISQGGCKQRDEIVFSNAYKHQIPIVASMGGGYSPLIKDVINAHANTFRVAKDMWG